MALTNSVRSLFSRLALIGIAIICIAGCSSITYRLDRDKSLTTSWGSVFQYKIDSRWSEPEWSSKVSNDDNFASALYSSDNEDDWLGVSIHAQNPNGSLTKYSSTSTYGDWIDSQEKNYSQTAEEQAAWHKEHISKYTSSDPALDDPNHYPDYKDFSLNQIGDRTINGAEFRLYKMEYTLSYSEKAYATLKEKNPGTSTPQQQRMTEFYAIVKDGSHDVEINTTNSQLLNDFLNTLQIKW